MYFTLKTKHLFLIKKNIYIYNTFWKENRDVAGKEHWWPKRRIFYCGPWRRPYYWEIKKDLITEDPKENLINEKSIEDTITVTPIDSPINKDSQDLHDPQWLLRYKLTLFDFLLMAYDRVVSGDKISKENFGLGRRGFHATSHLKLKLKYFSCKR